MQWKVPGLIALVFGSCLAGLAQTAPSSPTTTPSSRALGVVLSVDATGIVMQPDSGPKLKVVVQSDTKLLRVPAGEKDLKNASKIGVNDLSVGDRMLARGRLSDDQQTFVAETIIVMTKADITKKHEADRAEWQRRGIGGVVTSVNPDGKELMISVSIFPPTASS